MTIDNQHAYWNSVASLKTFTHPLDNETLDKYFAPGFKILDYGCGYGRLTNELYAKGFSTIMGIDTSAGLIKRGQELYPYVSLTAINDVTALDNFDTDFDAVLLFAVLTCIPSNAGQKELINYLCKRLRKGGVLYISDYYLQKNTDEVKKYTYLENDQNNYGVFGLPEGAVFRHHTKEWIQQLLEGMEIVAEKTIPVQTMNGHTAEAFQLIVKK